MTYNEKSCTLCPRRCRIDRSVTHGFCGAGNKIKIAAAMPHIWEEPCISGQNGSGTIFFSGCSLGCVFCQNNKISNQNFGSEISAERFAEICFELKEQGVHNISLVTADQYLPYILPTVVNIKSALDLPIVYNCSGYQSHEILSVLSGIVDIYLPDLKFFSPEISRKYANAPDYFDVSLSAIKEMVRQTGGPVIDDGIMKRGVIVRHLILPGARKDSIQIIKALEADFESDEILVSLMAQYTPCENEGAPKRKITTFEYESVLNELQKSNFRGYTQQLSSADGDYTPDFCLQGVTKR